jgi:hydroxymethylbilane synthase
MPSPRLRLGTRASPLARWQADWVAGELRKRGVEIELVLISTQGDVKTGPLGQIGGQGLFTKEIQRALLDGQIDLAVHSLKDLPTAEVEGLSLAAVPERESIADVLVCNSAKSLSELPKNARVGTGSLRRRAQLLHQRHDLQMLEIRGNVETRLRKLDHPRPGWAASSRAGFADCRCHSTLRDAAGCRSRSAWNRNPGRRYIHAAAPCDSQPRGNVSVSHC